MINRYNYEEFFLLYVDDELNDSERAAVENFVDQNEDLSKEFKMLRQSKLLADDNVTFASKGDLYKVEEGISLNHYEEYFLLALDKELDSTGSAGVEKFILQHPQLQEEFTLLQQTVLPIEHVEFANKTTLYKYEAKERRFTPMAFMRVGVAASILGVIATLWMLNKNDNIKLRNTDNVAVHQPKIKVLSQPTNEIKVRDTVTQQNLASLHVKSKHMKIVAEKIMVKNDEERKKVQAIKTPAIKQVLPTPLTEDNLIVAEIQKSSPEKLLPTNNLPGKNTTNTNNINSSENNIAKSTFALQPNMQNSNSLMQHAVYTEVGNDEESNTIYIGAVEINKTKFKALIRKAVSFFDKKTNTNKAEKTVQIASFQIKK